MRFVACKALEKAQLELSKTRYEGCNVVIADASADSRFTAKKNTKSLS
ncbi:MAG: hypothetical protein R3C05_23495 [Pirellulaceae bacterium]